MNALTRLPGSKVKRRRENQEDYERFVRSIPRWSEVEVPSWMPAPARDYLRWIEGMKRPKQRGDKERPRELVIAQRLATDPKMRHVWRTLEQAGAPHADNAIRQFYSRACGTPIPVMTLADRHSGIESLLNMAAICRNRRQNDSRVRDNPNLSKAFAQVEDYFETDAQATKRIDLRRFVKNHTKDDDARAYVRMLGHETQRLFGATLYRTVATVATIVLARRIEWRQVRNWCSPNPTNAAAD